MMTVRGTFYRAVDPRYRDAALSGSRAAGRYSRAEQPTLYLSSSLEGVEAAMIAHRDARSRALSTMEIEVDASRIADLRDPEAATRLGISVENAAAPWQAIAAAGGTPLSWLVRERLIELGAHGLIDPSRQRPGLWHLVLFRWNEPGAPQVRVLGSAADERPA